MIEDAGVLVAGGYGVVGSRIAAVLRARHPQMRLALAGRTPKSGAELARTLGHAVPVRVDVSEADPLADISPLPKLVIAAVNDADDHLLLACVRRGIGYIDITRWTENMRSAIIRLACEDVSGAPVIFSSSWMAGIAAILARGAANRLGGAASIDIDILYAMKDMSGPNSVEYMDRYAIPFEVVTNGRRQKIYPFSDPRNVDFATGALIRVYRFDAPDQMTLPLITGAPTVATRMGFDSKSATLMLKFMIKTGVWAAISGARFRRFRHGLLHNPGPGDHHRIVIDVLGTDGRRERMLADDALGQTHLTACGAVIQAERALGLLGQHPARSGVQFAEAETDDIAASRILEELGVKITQS